MRIWHIGPEIGKNPDKLINFFPVHIFSNPIQDKGKIQFKRSKLHKKAAKTLNFENLKKKNFEIFGKSNIFII
jgi:hypothetical protein